MRLEKINDPDPKYINAVIIWGIRPISCLADSMITMQDDSDLVYLFGTMIQERCEDLEKCLLRLYGEKPENNGQIIDIDQLQGGSYRKCRLRGHRRRDFRLRRVNH